MFFGKKETSSPPRRKGALHGAICTGGSNNNIEFWNPKTGTRLAQITSPRYTQYSFDYLGPNYMVCGTDQVAMLINLKKKNVQKQFTGHTSFIWSIRAINSDRFVSAGGDTTCRIWSAKKGSELSSFRHQSGNLRGIRVLKSLNGRIASCGSSGYVKVWNMKRTKEEYSLHPTPHGQLWDVAEDHRSKVLVVGGYTQPFLYFFDTRNLKKKFAVSPRLSNYVTSLMTLPERKEVWSVHNDGNCYIYDLRKTGSHRLNFKPSPSCIYRIKRLGDRYSNYVAMGGMDYNVRIFDIKKVTKNKHTAIKEWRTNTYVYGIGFCGRSRGGGAVGPLLSYHSNPKQLQAQRMKFYREEDTRFQYVMNSCFQKTDLKFVFPNQKKSIGFWSYFFNHCPQIVARKKTESESSQKRIMVDAPVDVKQDLVLKFVLLKKKGIRELLSGEEELDEDDLSEEEINIPLFEDEEGLEEDDTGGGKLDSVFFTLAQKRTFLDYFIFFRKLGCSFEMLSVLYEVSKISQLELLLLLFLKCVREYETSSVQRLFLPHDELRLLEIEKQQKRKEMMGLSSQPKKAQDGKKSSDEKEEDNEDEYDDVLLQTLEKKLYDERKKKMERVEKLQERKRKKEEKRKEKKRLREKLLKEKKKSKKKKEKDEDDLLSESEEEEEEEVFGKMEEEEEDEEEEEEEEGEEEEMGSFLSGRGEGLMSSLFDEDGIDDFEKDMEEDEDDLIDQVKETIHFETSFCHFIFYMMKEREDDIRSNSRLLKYFIQVLEQLERCEVQALHEHKDFATLKVLTSRGGFGNRKRVSSSSDPESRMSSSTFLGHLAGPLYEGESSNLVLETKRKKTKFQVHKEIMILRSPFFYDFFSKKKDQQEEDEDEGEEEEEEEEEEIGRKKETILIEQLDGDELSLLVQYVYCGEIKVFDGDMKVVLRLMNHCHTYNDQRLVRALILYLSRVFRTKKKRMIVSFIVQHGHLLESDELQRKFAKSMELVELGEGETFDEKEMEILLHKSMKKYKVDNVIRKLREENKELKRKNEELEKEVKRLRSEK